MTDKKQILISIIIPIYNGQKYLMDCLKSIQEQTYKNLEIILLNDGSTDNTSEICKKSLQNDPRIVYYEKENNGVSSARNLGIEKSKGDYLFFIDNDDMIHKRYLESCIKFLQKNPIDFFTFPIMQVSSAQISDVFSSLNEEEAECQFQIRNPKESYLAMATEYEHWDFSAIGGKLISRKAIGDLRFNEQMHYGEDTLFIQQLMNKGITSARSNRQWYYYRIHEMNSVMSKYINPSPEYILSHLNVAEEEYKNKRWESAFYWQKMVYDQAQRGYQIAKEMHNKQIIPNIKKDMRIVLKSKSLCVRGKAKHIKTIIFTISPDFLFFMQKIHTTLQAFRDHIKDNLNGKKNTTGIITFHCADNFGAMLQAYGLKKALVDMGFKTDIIHYTPIYMTGRHWFIPYLPNKSIRHVLRMAYRGMKRNIKEHQQFFMRRKNMRNFRKKYLISSFSMPELFDWQLKFNKYKTYILGSDQIWNPELTYKLRKPYFGKIHKKNDYSFAYAASFGGTGLDSKYDTEITKLLQDLQGISMREESAIPYIKEHYKGEVFSVCDPVFLPERFTWNELITYPKESGYILVYATENIPELYTYAKNLAKLKNLKLIELAASVKSNELIYDTVAGPGEFLGYISNADYVVSNSFHGLAFCTIFHKQFVAYLHSSRGARIVDMLSAQGLQDRIITDKFDIDAKIDWKKADALKKELVTASKDYLLKYMKV